MISNEKNLMSDNTAAFKEIMAIIGNTRERVFRLVNREFIDMYWEIGRYISEKLSALLREISWTNWQKVQRMTKMMEAQNDAKGWGCWV